MAEKKKDLALNDQQPAAEQPAQETTTEQTKKPDETVPGGRYKVNGVWVDANGKRLADQSED